MVIIAKVVIITIGVDISKYPILSRMQNSGRQVIRDGIVSKSFN
jgi:hypothetical protein